MMRALAETGGEILSQNSLQGDTPLSRAASCGRNNITLVPTPSLDQADQPPTLPPPPIDSDVPRMVGVERVVKELGGVLSAPHMDENRVERFFVEKHRYPEGELLLQMARVGTPLSSVGPGGDLGQELAYGNHCSVDEFEKEVWEKVVADVGSGKALVFPKRMARDIPGLRVSPMGVVKEKGDKIRQIHDLTVELGGGGSVNATTKFDEVPECLLGQVMNKILTRIVGLRKKFPSLPILVQKMDLKGAFRQIPVDPAGAAAFAYVFGEFVVVDLRLQFGWRGSPGWFGLAAGAIEHAQCHTTKDTAVFTPSGLRAVEHVNIAPATGNDKEPIPAECIVPELEGGGEEDTACTAFYVDDAVSVEAKHEPDGGRCIVLSKSLASIHHLLLGERGEGQEPVLSHKKTTDWAPQMEVLGYAVDTEAMTIGLPVAKVQGIREVLVRWPPTRKSATVGEVLSLAGKLHHAAYVIRPARYFVHRLLQLTNLHLNGSERAGGGEAWGRFRKKKEKNRKLKLTSEFSAEVGWWRWYLGRQDSKKGERITSPAFNVVKQIPTRRWFCDASLGVMGGLCAVKRVFYRMNLPEEVVRRTLKHNSSAEGDFISINLLEVVAAVLTAFVMIKLRGDRPKREGEAVLIRADNSATVTWIGRCKGGTKGMARVGAVMRMMGALEIEGGFCFQAKHIPGKENKLADGITRWPEEQVYDNLMRESPGTPWQVHELGDGTRRIFTEILREATHLEELQSRLARIIRGLGGCGVHGEQGLEGASS